MIKTMVEKHSVVSILRKNSDGTLVFEVEMTIERDEHFLLQEIVKQAIVMSKEREGTFDHLILGAEMVNSLTASEDAIRKTLESILEKIYLPEPQN